LKADFKPENLNRFHDERLKYNKINWLEVKFWEVNSDLFLTKILLKLIYFEVFMTRNPNRNENFGLKKIIQEKLLGFKNNYTYI
jgi:hypothetical protein